MRPRPGATWFDTRERDLIVTVFTPVYTAVNAGSSVTDAFGNSVIGTSGQGLILNLTVTYEVMQGVTVFAKGRNLTDSRFEPVNGYQTPGTSFLAGTRGRF
jgi:vitamin B12 transporter